MRRRRLLKATGLATMGIAVAGCSDDSGGNGGDSGEDGGDESDDEDSGDGSDDTPAADDDTDGGSDSMDGRSGDGDSMDSDGETTAQCESTDEPLAGEVTGIPPELELVEEEASREGVNVATSGFEVKLTFRVTGDETVEPESYGYDLTVSDAEGTVLSSGRPVLGYRSRIEPGNTGPVFVSPIPELDCPSAAARYEIRIN